jgi:hypothetical protein
VTAAIASSSLVNPPKLFWILDFGFWIVSLIQNSQSKWWRSTKEVRLIVDQVGASSSLVATAKFYFYKKEKKIMLENYRKEDTRNEVMN